MDGKIITQYFIMKDGKRISRCGCLSEAVAECRERGYLSTEDIEIHKVYRIQHDWVTSLIYNVYGEVI